MNETASNEYNFLQVEYLKMKIVPNSLFLTLPYYFTVLNYGFTSIELTFATENKE